MLIRITKMLAVSLLFGPFALAQQSFESMNMNAQLISAAKRNQLDLLTRALKAGASPNSRNRAGDTPINFAARNGNIEMIGALLTARGDVNKANLEKVTPLMSAAFQGHVAAVELLLAAGNGQSAVVQALLKHGVDVNARYHNDLTALMWAVGNGDVATVKVLLYAGAEPSLLDNRGKSALAIARDLLHGEMIVLLEAARAAK